MNPIGYIDYPIPNFKDNVFLPAPIRRVFVLMYDGHKYVKFLIQQDNNSKGIIFELANCFIYSVPLHYNNIHNKDFSFKGMEDWEDQPIDLRGVKDVSSFEVSDATYNSLEAFTIKRGQIRQV